MENPPTPLSLMNDFRRKLGVLTKTRGRPSYPCTTSARCIAGRHHPHRLHRRPALSQSPTHRRPALSQSPTRSNLPASPPTRTRWPAHTPSSSASSPTVPTTGARSTSTPPSPASRQACAPLIAPCGAPLISLVTRRGAAGAAPRVLICHRGGGRGGGDGRGGGGGGGGGREGGERGGGGGGGGGGRSATPVASSITPLPRS